MRSVIGVLLLVGTGPLQNELQECVQECGVQDRVFMLGHVEDIVPYYKAARILAIPSITRAEAFGVVQMEAMAAGVPVVNTDIPSGVPEVSIHEQTGFTVQPKDPRAMADAINRLLDNAELRQRFGAAARQRVHDEFSAEKMVARTMAVYDSVMPLSM